MIMSSDVPGDIQFPTTRWSMVCRAGTGPGSEARRAMEQLLRAYLPALRAHLVFDRRMDRDRADDLLQAFATDKLIEQNIVAAANPGRGRFRNFLLVTLQRFVIDRARQEQSQRRAPQRGRKLKNLDDHTEDSAVYEPPPSDAFDRAWAQEVLNEVMRRMRSHCEQSDQPHLWGIFESRVLLPMTEGAEPAAHDELARRYKLPSASHASNALGSAKRLFTRLFRDVVGEYAQDDAEVDSELRDLWDAFAKRQA
jgi:RNA polymerase sigma-70 factor (ECF subfamily)